VVGGGWLKSAGGEIMSKCLAQFCSFPQLFLRLSGAFCGNSPNYFDVAVESLICFYFQSGVGKVGGFLFFLSFSFGGNLLHGLPCHLMKSIMMRRTDDDKSNWWLMKMKCHLL